MSVKRFIPIALIGGAAIALIAVMMATAPQPKRGKRPTPVPIVSVRELAREDVAVSAEAFGVVEAARRTEMRPQVAGQIIETNPELRPGGVIKKGETLVRIEPVDYEVALDEARAALAEAEAGLMIEKGEQAVAAQEFEEFGPLENVTDVGRALARREPQLRRAEAGVAAARARVRRAQLDLERTRLRAPFDAVVLARDADIGQSVSSQSVIAVIADLSEFWIEAALPVDRAAAVAAAAKASDASAVVELKAGLSDPRRWPARVLNRTAAIDEEGRLARVLVAVDDPLGVNLEGAGSELPIGAYVRVTLPAGVVEDVYRLPRASVGIDGAVWVRTAEGRLASRPVQVVWRREADILARLVMEEGDALIVSPLSKPTPGRAVRVREAGDGVDPVREAPVAAEAPSDADEDGGPL